MSEDNIVSLENESEETDHSDAEEMEKKATYKHELDSKYFEQTPRTTYEGRGREDDIADHDENEDKKRKVQCDEKDEGLVIDNTSLSKILRVQVNTEIIESNMVTGYEQSCDLEALRKPGRKGWLREIVYSRVVENLVININYIPPGSKKRGKQLVSKKDVEIYLSETDTSSTLTIENFAFFKRLLGLGNGLEVTRISNADCTQRKPYKQFFKIVEGSSPPKVLCKLCAGKYVSYINFSRHMELNHLPDENCPKCLEDIPASIFRNHSGVCDGTATIPSAPRVLLPLFSQFYTNLEGTSPARVSCNLCDVKSIYRENLTQHMRNCHLPDEACSKCLQDFPARVFRDHTRACVGPTVSDSTSYSQFFTKVEGTIPIKVACNLCDGKLVTRNNFSRHYKRLHKFKKSTSKSQTEFPKNPSNDSEEQKGLETKLQKNQDPEQDTDNKMELKPGVQYKKELDQSQDEERGDPNQTLQSDALNVSFSSSDASEIQFFSETDSE